MSAQMADYDCVVSVRWVSEHFWLEIEHNGSISWETMQAIKNDYFGAESTCYEVFPAQAKVVNSGNFRHLWRAPDMAAFVGMQDCKHNHRPDAGEARQSDRYRPSSTELSLAESANADFADASEVAP